MVGVVVRDEQCFAEEILAFTPAEGFVEIGLWIFYEGDEGFEIRVDGLDGSSEAWLEGGCGDFGQ